jgi:hypothetical protein
MSYLDSNKFYKIPNSNIGGYDIKFNDNTIPSDCENQCNGNSDCTWINAQGGTNWFSGVGSKCWLKSPSKNKQGINLGIRFPDNSYDVYYNQDIAGHELSFIPGLSNNDQCQAQCNSNPECKFYVTTPDNPLSFAFGGNSGKGGCYLKKLEASPGNDHYWKKKARHDIGDASMYVLPRASDAPGWDFERHDRVSMNTCLDDCMQNEKCDFVDYDKNAGTCWLKSMQNEVYNVGVKRSDKLFDIHQGKNLYFNGDLITNIRKQGGDNRIAGERDCMTECANNNECSFYVFNPDDGNCWIKRTIANPNIQHAWKINKRNNLACCLGDDLSLGCGDYQPTSVLCDKTLSDYCMDSTRIFDDPICKRICDPTSDKELCKKLYRTKCSEGKNYLNEQCKTFCHESKNKAFCENLVPNKCKEDKNKPDYCACYRPATSFPGFESMGNFYDPYTKCFIKECTQTDAYLPSDPACPSCFLNMDFSRSSSFLAKNISQSCSSQIGKQPETPSTPTKPDEPVHPDQTKPITPVQPDQPTKPDQPSKPDQIEPEKPKDEIQTWKVVVSIIGGILVAGSIISIIRKLFAKKEQQ